MNEGPRKRREGCIKWDILFPDSHSPSMTLSWSLHEYYKWCSNTTTTSYIILLFLTTTTTIITSWDDDCVSYTSLKKRMNEPHTGKSVLRKKEKKKETDWRKRGVTLGWEMDSEEDEAGSQFFPLPERIHIPLVFFYFSYLSLVSIHIYEYQWWWRRWWWSPSMNFFSCPSLSASLALLFFYVSPFLA